LNILVSNDDGVLAQGIQLLADVCRDVADVVVVAPDRQQSAASHSLTMFRPLRPVRVSKDRYQVDGTPTDCILLALELLLERRPDFVFSGVNHGPNMGEDVLYSGTVAAAMEALSAGVPGIAVSFAGDDMGLIETQRDWLGRLVGNIVRVEDFPGEMLLNINLPGVPGDQIRGIRTTTLGRRVFSDSLKRMTDPWGREIYWIGGGKSSWSGREDSDFRAVAEGYISVTPLHLDLTSYKLLESVRSWRLGE
jgi:5'/3'-nucleotidase